MGSTRKRKQQSLQKASNKEEGIKTIPWWYGVIIVVAVYLITHLIDIV
jgi:hypothetical protein